MKTFTKKILLYIFITNFITLINCSQNMEILFHEKEKEQVGDALATIEYGSLSGKIYDTYKNQVEGADITVSDSARSIFELFTTDIGGNFSFESLPEGEYLYSITVEKTGFNTKTSDDISIEADTNNDLGIIYIESNSVLQGKITGTLIDAIHGTPVNDAQVSITKFDDTNAGGENSDANGNFTTVNLQPGAYVVTITKPGYIDLVLDVDIDGSQNLNDIPFYPEVVNNGSITGKIFDSFTNEISGVLVTISNPTGFISETTSTNASGTFTFASLPEGMNIYTITAEKTGYNTSIKNNVSVVAGSVTDVGIIYLVSTSATSGTMTGRVIDANDGVVLPGATIQIVKFDETIADTTTSDASGNFTTSSLEPGSYTVIVSKANYYDLVIDNRIVNGDTNIYNLALCSYLVDNQMRVYVLWANQPLDLDLHVVGPTSNADTSNPLWDGNPSDRFHTYYMLNLYNELTGLYNSGSPVDGTSAMVQDANTGVGPETINFGGTYEYGTYTFTIFNFSKTAWHGGDYMPVLRIYDALGLVQEVPFPSSPPAADEWYWKVFKMEISGPTKDDRIITIPVSGHYMNYSDMEFMDKSLMDW